VLETTDSIEEISRSTPLDIEAATLCAGSILSGHLVVQVTPRRICFMRAAEPRAPSPQAPVDFAPQVTHAASTIADSLALSASISDPYVVVRFTDTVRLFATCSESQTDEVSAKLPELPAGGAMVSVCLHRDQVSGTTFLVVVVAASRGTLLVVDLRTMKEVFRTERLSDVPPVLRNRSCAGSDLDHLRPFSDICAILCKSGAEAPQLAATRVDETAATCTVLSAEFVEVDADDRGPTLVVFVVGRPILIYRAFLTNSQQAFPYNFILHEHDFLGLVEAATHLNAHRPVASLRYPSSSHAGAIVVPPCLGIPALWLAARQNQLFVHPLPGLRFRGITALHAPCCENGLFSLVHPSGTSATVAQVHALATLDGFPDGQASFELRGPFPYARQIVQRTPRVMATKPGSGFMALAVSEAVVENPNNTGLSVDEDPLGDDWSIVRVPPVEAEPPLAPRTHSQYELWIEQTRTLSKLGQYRFSFDSDEAVLSLTWISIPGFPENSVAVGTGVNTGEDLTCRGRVLIFSTRDRDPGVIPPVYQRSVKWPVTVVGQINNYLIHAEGSKIYLEKWEGGSFNKLAFFDLGMCVTSLSSIKNFLLFGDLRKGIDFLQWKEEVATQTKNLRRLSRSPPSAPITVLACEFVVCQKSLGLVALDHAGSAHLFSYSPHSDGREGDRLLRSCATFSMGYPCRASLRLQAESGVQSVMMASGAGELLCLRPIDDQIYRTITTLLGMLCTRLPFRCGLNPRAARGHDGPPSLVAPRKNVEDAVLLRLFAFLSSPLQRLIGEKMRLPVASILQTTMPYANCQMLSMRTQPAVLGSGSGLTAVNT